MYGAAKRPSAFIVSRCLEPPFKHEVRVFEIASQSIKIDMLIALFIEQFNTSKEIVRHTIELIWNVTLSVLMNMLIKNNFMPRV